jgi:transcriptional regulator with XRE-family HTH domain
MAGLTQEELAERAGLSRRGVSDLERGLRRHPYRYTADRLIEALGIGPAEREAFYAARRSPLPHTTDDLPRSSVPVPRTSFVGRTAELDQLRRLFEVGRLVTLTGVGGVGKTRLALELARAEVDEFEQGVHFVPLAGVGTSPLLVSALATL